MPVASSQGAKYLLRAATIFLFYDLQKERLYRNLRYNFYLEEGGKKDSKRLQYSVLLHRAITYKQCTRYLYLSLP
jgi:hypothetical protein